MHRTSMTVGGSALRQTGRERSDVDQGHEHGHTTGRDRRPADLAQAGDAADGRSWAGRNASVGPRHRHRGGRVAGGSREPAPQLIREPVRGPFRVRKMRYCRPAVGDSRLARAFRRHGRTRTAATRSADAGESLGHPRDRRPQGVLETGRHRGRPGSRRLRRVGIRRDPDPGTGTAGKANGRRRDHRAIRDAFGTITITVTITGDGSRRPDAGPQPCAGRRDRPGAQGPGRRLSAPRPDHVRAARRRRQASAALGRRYRTSQRYRVDFEDSLGQLTVEAKTGRRTTPLRSLFCSCT